VNFFAALLDRGLTPVAHVSSPFRFDPKGEFLT
jgi:hypothetical protein